MGPQVHAALNQLQAALAPSDFDPATSELYRDGAYADINLTSLKAIAGSCSN